MKVLIYRVMSAIMLLCCMTIIFNFSAQDAEQSTETSSKVIEKVAKAVYPDFEELDDNKKQEKIDGLQFTVRKLAHFLIYTALGIFAFLTMVSYRGLKLKVRVFISLAFCLFYAVSDELHQLLSAGRSCELRDVLIDFAGAFIGVGVSFLIVRFIKPIYKLVSFRGDKFEKKATA